MTYKEHMDSLSILLRVLKDQKHFVKFRKCDFLWFVAFLGHIVSINGIEVDKKRTVTSGEHPLDVTIVVVLFED